MLHVLTQWWQFKTEKEQGRWRAIGCLAVAVFLGLLAIFYGVGK